MERALPHCTFEAGVRRFCVRHSTGAIFSDQSAPSATKKRARWRAFRLLQTPDSGADCGACIGATGTYWGNTQPRPFTRWPRNIDLPVPATAETAFLVTLQTLDNATIRRLVRRGLVALGLPDGTRVRR